MQDLVKTLGAITTYQGLIVLFFSVIFFLIYEWWPSLKLLRKFQYPSINWIFFIFKSLITIGITLLFNRSLLNTIRAIVEQEILRPDSRKQTQNTDSPKRTLKDIARHMKLNNDEPESIVIDNCYELFRSEDIIKEYLETIESLDVARDKYCFISKIKINDGFISPIFLVSGLQDRFKEEWKPILDKYKADIVASSENKPITEELKKLQIFIFNCWMSWGPSIPLCSCSSWGIGTQETALQYGYGDEDNSVPIYLKDDENERKFKELINVSKSASEGIEACIPLAFSVAITGKLHWGPDAFTKDNLRERLCNAQQSVKDDDTGVLVLSDAVILAKQVDRNNQIPQGYYSAYLWVIFVIMIKKGEEWEPLYPFETDDAWRGLIPFFEHANIADGNTYDFLSQQLATKALSSATRILRENKRIGLYYACAVDDSHCIEENGTANTLKYEVPPKVILKYMNKLVKNLTEPSSQDVSHDRGNIDELIKQKDDKRLNLPYEDNKSASERRELPKGLSTCHLPDIIKKYYLNAKRRN